MAVSLDYHILRTFADSWGLLAMVVFFVGAVIFVMRPSAKALHGDAAAVPFKEQD